MASKRNPGSKSNQSKRQGTERVARQQSRGSDKFKGGSGPHISEGRGQSGQKSK